MAHQSIVVRTILLILLSTIVQCETTSPSSTTSESLTEVESYLKQYQRQLASATSPNNPIISSENFGNYHRPLLTSNNGLHQHIQSKSESNKFNSGQTLASASSMEQEQIQLHQSSSNQYPTVQMLTSSSQSVSSNHICESRHTTVEFDIKSEGYPNRNYSNNQDCVYYIIRESPEVCGLELRFNKFNLEQSEGCAYDFLEIDGENFCGKLPDGSRNIFRFDPKQEVKTISFQTDSQGTNAGFDIHVKQLKDCNNAFMPVKNEFGNGNGLRTHKCTFVSSEREARMTSLRFPDPYPDDILCVYTIERPKRPDSSKFCSVELRFTNFDLQESEDCVDDFLELENQRYCGQQLNGTSKIVKFDEDGAIKFLFKTDNSGSVDSKGFALNYTLIECIEGQLKTQTVEDSMDEMQTEFESERLEAISTTTIATISTDQSLNNKGFGLKKLASTSGQSNQTNHFYRAPCFQLFTDQKFVLSSDLVNGTYRENLECLFTIRRFSSKVCYLEMHFRQFDLEASPDCQYDYVEIGTAVRLCGTLQRETSRIYRFDRPEMFVNFHTDASTERAGFKIDVNQLECDGDRIVRKEQSSDAELDDSLQRLDSQRELREPEDDGVQHVGQFNQTSQAITKPQQVVLQQQETSEFDLFDGRGIRGEGESRFEKADYYCSKILEEKEFFIHSPGYPSGYQTELDCLYLIRPYRPTVCKIEINFDQFELQPYDYSKNCLRSDFVDIDSREQLCGKLPESQSKMYSFLNQSFFIHFHSDTFRTNFDKGFRLFVRQIDCDRPPYILPQQNKNAISGRTSSTSITTPHFSRCNKIFSGSSFELKSPLYPSSYLSNSYCQYRIIKIRAEPIKICYLEVNFHEFDLQESPNCTKDFLSFNGVRICGHIVRDSIRLFPFYDNEFVITFSSDRVINNRGFHLQIRQQECATPPDPIKTSRIPQRPPKDSTRPHFSNYQIIQANQQCQQHSYGSKLIEFQSPGYPTHYLPSLSCAYTIRKRNSQICQLEIYFIDLDIESTAGRCRFDYLLIDDEKYCNANRPTTGSLVLPFYESEKRILFRSGVDYRYGRKGFVLQARQIDCTTPNDVLPSVISPPPSAGIFPAEKFVFLPSLPSICEICVTEVTGNLQSYDYPNYYPPNVNCTYRITPLPDNCMVQMRFDEFDFDMTPECDRDYLEINGVRYCGNQLKDVSMILLNKRREDLSIRMVSHSRGAIVKPSFRGFRASYTQLPCLGAGETRRPITTKPPTKDVGPREPSVIIAPPPSRKTIGRPQPQPRPIASTSRDQQQQVEIDRIYCDTIITSERYDLKSPGYPYRYFNNLNCMYQIEKSSANVCRLRITFNYFNIVGEDGQCSGDYLEAFNSKICGVLERYTKKEIPFLQQKIMLNFHSNEARTANGFHLLLEQIDCIQGAPGQPMDNIPYPMSNTPQPTGPNHRQEVMKYDDDEITPEFDQSKKTVSTMNPLTMQETTITMQPKTTMTTTTTTTTTSTTTPSPTETRRPVKIAEKSRVTYEEQEMEPIGTPGQPDSETYPLRYFSRNITVIGTDQRGLNRNDRPYPPTPVEWHTQQRIKWDSPTIDPVKGGPIGDVDDDNQPSMQFKRPSICNKMEISDMYFEIQSDDLLPSGNGITRSCQVLIHKSKPSICQLDIHFVQYWANNDTTCGQQYLSIDGERICGEVPANTIKKFWFVRPDLYLFVKLPKRSNGNRFMIKARQVECAHNLNQSQSSNEMKKMLPYPNDVKPRSYGTKSQGHYYSQVKSNDRWPEQRPELMATYGSSGQPQPEQVAPRSYNPSCDQIATETNYRIVSPRPSNVGSHHCRYTIRRTGDKICALDIKFVSFHLAEDQNESLNRCSSQYIEIDSGKICGAFPVGHERRYHFLSNEEEKMIYYHSNQSKSGDFVLDVKQVDDCSKPLTPQRPTLSMPTICDISSSALRGQLKSPNYPSPYDDFTRCTYRIQAVSDNYCSLKIMINDLDIEKGHDHGRMACEKDALKLRHNMRLCGRELSQNDYTIPFEFQNGQRVAEIQFSSDAKGSGRGFNLDFIQELCPTKSMEPTYRGSYKGPTSPGRASKTNQLRFEKLSDANSLIRNPMRPNYPPNYVSKAHLLKSMDRKQFIKLMLQEEEREKMRLNINSSTSSSSSTTEKPTEPTLLTSSSTIPTTTIGSTLIPTTIQSNFLSSEQSITTMDPTDQIGMITTTSTSLIVNTADTTSNPIDPTTQITLKLKE